MILFIPIRWLDVLDVLLVAFLIFQLYKLVKGTVAIRIFLGILAIYLLWKLVSAVQMELLSEILGQFIGVGVLALIIVFQQEIRRFLLLLGSQSPFGGGIIKKVVNWSKQTTESDQTNISAIVRACQKMSKTKTGALIVISLGEDMSLFTNTGEKIDGLLSERLLSSIFFKNSPMHDGAVLIYQNKISRAACILPISESPELTDDLGLRHRAAVGITENSSSLAIVVSEENGQISIANGGKIKHLSNYEELNSWLKTALSSN